MPNLHSYWPRITAVTPSFNQGRFLEQTIRSVLGQEHLNLEYIIMNGGSEDHSVDVIRKYAAHLRHRESRPDRGQAHAINNASSVRPGTFWRGSTVMIGISGAVYAAVTQFDRMSIIRHHLAHRSGSGGEPRLKEIVEVVRRYADDEWLGIN